VLDRLPKEASGEKDDTSTDAAALDDSFMDILKEMRYETGNPQKKRKKKVNVEPGKSVTGLDFEESEEDATAVSAKTTDAATNSGEDKGASSSGDDEESDDEMSSERTSNDTGIPVSAPGTSYDNVDHPHKKRKTVVQPVSGTGTSTVTAAITSSDKFQQGDFVIFEYEGEQFPGQVLNVQQYGCVIRSMVKSGMNWKWPDKADELFYLYTDIKTKIKPPQSLNRGVLVVQELKERWDEVHF